MLGNYRENVIFQGRVSSDSLFFFAKITDCIIENDEGGQKYDTIHNSTYYDPYISGGGDCCHKYWRQCIPRDIW